MKYSIQARQLVRHLYYGQDVAWHLPEGFEDSKIEDVERMFLRDEDRIIIRNSTGIRAIFIRASGAYLIDGKDKHNLYEVQLQPVSN